MNYIFIQSMSKLFKKTRKLRSIHLQWYSDGASGTPTVIGCIDRLPIMTCKKISTNDRRPD